jgi:hypothetical protein
MLGRRFNEAKSLPTPLHYRDGVEDRYKDRYKDCERQHAPVAAGAAKD